MPLKFKLGKLFRKRLNSSSSSTSSATEERSCNIVVMGPTGVGKTSLTEEFQRARVDCDSHQTSDYRLHQELYQVDGNWIKVDIVDVSSDSKAMLRRVIAQGDAFILVHSLTDRLSFKDVKVLRDTILDIKGDLNVPILIVGNKLDLIKRDRHIKRAVIEAVVQTSWGHQYFELSCLDHAKVCDVFNRAINGAVHGPVFPAVSTPKPRRRYSEMLHRDVHIRAHRPRVTTA